MTYARLLLVLGFAPTILLWLIAPDILRRHTGSLLVIVGLILMASIPWESLAIDRIWYYSPRVLWGGRFLNLPIEELAFFAIDGLLVGTLALHLEKKLLGLH